MNDRIWKRGKKLSRKKHPQDMNPEELLQFAQALADQHQRRNARRRERRQWLKNAPREQTALRYLATERPCSVALYLQAERFLLRWLPEFPDLQGDPMCFLLR